MRAWLWLVSGVVPMALLSPCPAGPQGPSRLLLTQPLPRLDGAHLRVTLVEVTYPAGGSSAPHSHPCPVVGYVLAGHLRFAVDGGIDSTFVEGEGFYEASHGVHRISANASTTEPVRFLAWFVCESDTPLSTPLPEPGHHD